MILLAEFFGHDSCDVPDSFLREIRRVGAHIGDKAALVEFLGRAHGSRRCKTEPRRSRLLHRRGREGRARGSCGFCFFNTDNAPLLGFRGLVDALCFLFVGRLLGADGREAFFLFCFEFCAQDTKFLGHEGTYLTLSFHKDAQGGRLHPAG